MTYVVWFYVMNLKFMSVPKISNFMKHRSACVLWQYTVTILRILNSIFEMFNKWNPEQGKLLNGWIKNSMRRKLRVEKRCEIEKLKQGIKLVHILRSEMGMLNEWCRIEGRNMEAVGRVVRKLSAISLCVPLVQDAQVLNYLLLNYFSNLHFFILSKLWNTKYM